MSARTHEKLLKMFIREHSDAAAFHSKAIEKLTKELAAWKKNLAENNGGGKK